MLRIRPGTLSVQYLFDVIVFINCYPDSTDFLISGISAILFFFSMSFIHSFKIIEDHALI